MNKDKVLNTAIKLLTKLKTTQPKKKKRKNSNTLGYSFKKWLIILVILLIAFTFARSFYLKGRFDDIIELWENAGVDIGAFDEKDTRRYQRKQKEAIRLKKASELEKIQAEVKRAQKDIASIKESYLELQDEYSDYGDIYGKFNKGVVRTEYNQSVIDKYRGKQQEIISKLEECEYLIEHTIRSHIKKAKRLHKEIETIKSKIGELALKGQKGLSEKEISELDALANKVKTINKWQLVTDREKLIFAFFETNDAHINHCPCIFMINELWNEVSKDEYFMQEIVPLRLKMHMQEYRHIIWKMDIMENKLN